MFCRKCGKEIPDDSEFCPKCGTKIGKDILEQVNALTDKDYPEDPKSYSNSETMVEKELPEQVNVQTAETVTDSTTYSAGELQTNDSVNVASILIEEKKTKSSKWKRIVSISAVTTAMLAVILIPIIVSIIIDAHGGYGSHLREEVTYSNSNDQNVAIPDEEFEYQLKSDDTYVISKYIGTNLNVVIPDYIDGKPVSEIGESAFSGSSIESVIFGKNVWEIGRSAFYGCRSLRSVEILPNDDFVIDAIAGDILINTIGDTAFSNCSALETLILPGNNFTKIGVRAFYQCSALKKAELTGIRSIGEKAFYECGLQSVNLHSGDTASAVFANCRNLKEVTLGNLVDISDEMFSGCTSLETVTWTFSPYMDNEIGSKAFYGCTSLKQFNTIDTPITYPRGFSEFIEKFRLLGAKDIVIGKDAFANCEKFKDPKLTTKHNEWAGTCYFGKTLREAIKYANDWEMSTYLGNCVKFYDPLGDVIANECYDYNDKIYLVILHDKNRYLSSDLGKTDFVYVGITLNEVFGLLGHTQINYVAMSDSYSVSYELYGYNFELNLSGSSLNSIVTSVWIRSD